MPRIVDTDEQAPKARPKSASPPPPAEDLKRPHTPDERKLAEAVGTAYQALGGGLIALGFRLQDGGLVGTGGKTLEMAPAIADAWIDLSRRNPAVKAYLKKLTEVSAVGMLVGVHFACAIPLLVSRGVLPAAMAEGMTADGDAETEDVFAAAMNGNGE